MNLTKQVGVRLLRFIVVGALTGAAAGAGVWFSYDAIADFITEALSEWLGDFFADLFDIDLSGSVPEGVDATGLEEELEEQAAAAAQEEVNRQVEANVGQFFDDNKLMVTGAAAGIVGGLAGLGAAMAGVESKHDREFERQAKHQQKIRRQNTEARLRELKRSWDTGGSGRGRI